MRRSRRNMQLAKLAIKFSGRTENPKDKGEVVIMHKNGYLQKTEHERGYAPEQLGSRKKWKSEDRGRNKWVFLSTP